MRSINTNVAKNIILFIGDGMSLTTLTASRIYKAQFKGRNEGRHVKGEESSLTFQKFPHTALSKTYCVDRQTPDSSSTASAARKTASKFAKCQTHTFQMVWFPQMFKNNFQKSANNLKDLCKIKKILLARIYKFIDCTLHLYFL